MYYKLYDKLYRKEFAIILILLLLHFLGIYIETTKHLYYLCIYITYLNIINVITCIIINKSNICIYYQ